MKSTVRWFSEVATWFCAPLALPPDVADHFLTIDAARACMGRNRISVEIWYANNHVATLTNDQGRQPPHEEYRKFQFFGRMTRSCRDQP